MDVSWILEKDFEKDYPKTRKLPKRENELMQDWKVADIIIGTTKSSSKRLKTAEQREKIINELKSLQALNKKYYIVRRWDDNGKKQYAHFFPKKDGKPPKGFNTKEQAQKYADEWQKGQDIKIVTRKEAKNYQVPARM